MCQSYVTRSPEYLVDDGLGSRLPRRGLAKDSADEQEVMRCQRIREIVESYLIGSCGNDRISATLGDDEVRERLHARHTAKLNLILLALAEVFDGIMGPDCH